MSEQLRPIECLKEKVSNNNKSSQITMFGEVLERTYPLLQIIFKNLLYEDLKSASQVNDVWARYGIEEIKKRNKASWISLNKYYSRKVKIENSSNFKYDAIIFGFIFYNYRLIKLDKLLCAHVDSTSTATMTFSEYLINEIMPKDSDFWAFSCSSVYSPILEKGYQCSFAGVFVPQIPNIKMKQFITSQDEADIFEKDISKNEHIHCALLFTCAPYYAAHQFLTNLSKRKYVEKTALGGGIISKGIKSFQNNVSKSNTLFCMAFTQEMSVSADFDAYSIVISQDTNFKEDLIRFKEQICLREYSFALRICCAAKRHKQKESILFNAIFPNIFIVGLDADGEFGWNKFDSWQPEEDVPETKKQKIFYNLCHEYSTVIVILTWGRKMPNTH